MTQEIRTRQEWSDTPTELDLAVERLNEGLFGAFGGWPFGATGFRDGGDLRLFRAARTDVVDTGAAYRLSVEVPGIPKEKLDIRVRGSSVEIRGEHGAASEKNDGAFVHRERRFAGFFRALELPEPVVAEQAKAHVEHGILELELPKQHPTSSTDGVKVAVQ